MTGTGNNGDGDASATHAQRVEMMEQQDLADAVQWEFSIHPTSHVTSLITLH